MSPVNIEITTWLLWVAVGIVMALVWAWIYGGRKMLAYALFVGVVCSIAGGWGTAWVVGDSVQSQLIVSVLSAVFVGAVGLYILNKIAFRKSK